MKQMDIFDLDKREVEKLEDGSNLITRPMEEVMHDSMMPYAEHVILDRALPRVEDGLKPVQRRILYSMYEQGVTPDKPYRKSARIVGDCMGRYHPHGDSSIYDAMVRMAQSFSMSVPLIQGQGNFGNVDGDSAAAMRYTEARLAPVALELLRDIEKDTVKWSRNFDDTTKEPDMLPGRYPNLLVNGASGIAVGLATNIPPHNLGEVIDGVVAYIENRNKTACIEHEATTSKISDEQLFYCMQRGIGQEEAVSLIVNGFCKEVMQQLPMEFAIEAAKLINITLEGSVG